MIGEMYNFEIFHSAVCLLPQHKSCSKYLRINSPLDRSGAEYGPVCHCLIRRGTCLRLRTVEYYVFRVSSVRL